MTTRSHPATRCVLVARGTSLRTLEFEPVFDLLVLPGEVDLTMVAALRVLDGSELFADDTIVWFQAYGLTPPTIGLIGFALRARGDTKILGPASTIAKLAKAARALY